MFSFDDFSVRLLKLLFLEQKEEDFFVIGSIFMSSLLKNPEVLWNYELFLYYDEITEGNDPF